MGAEVCDVEVAGGLVATEGDGVVANLGACITQLPTRTYQTCQTLLLHLPEPSMSLPL